MNFIQVRSSSIDESWQQNLNGKISKLSRQQATRTSFCFSLCRTFNTSKIFIWLTKNWRTLKNLPEIDHPWSSPPDQIRSASETLANDIHDKISSHRATGNGVAPYPTPWCILMFQKAIGEKCHGLLRRKIPTGHRGWSNPRVLQEAVTTWHWLQLEIAG